MDIFMTILGYVGAVGIAIFSLPELIRCLKNKKTSDINVALFLLLAFSSTCFYVTGFYNIKWSNLDSQQMFNLAVAIANVFSFSVPAILLSYKLVNRVLAKKNNMTEKEYEEFIKTKKETNSSVQK